MRTHDFIDAQFMHRQHPTTFDSPTDEELNAIKVGDNVKVALKGERFWTKVTKIEDDTFTANVDNDLVGTENHGLKLGDLISFERKHIYDIYTK